ncbi:MAG: IS200/IS605 family transposase [Marinifilaceae bacterium]
MSRFNKLSHTLWHSKYHIVWTPKYRYRILYGEIKKEVESCILLFVDQQGGKVEELNVQGDHIHLLVQIPPKIAVSKFVGTIKGRTAIRVFQKFKTLKHRPYWGNHFWARGYCVDTVGLNEEMIRKYVKHQENKEKQEEHK